MGTRHSGAVPVGSPTRGSSASTHCSGCSPHCRHPFALVAAVVHAQAYGGEDALAVLADGLGQGDEGLEPTALGAGAEAVEQAGDLGLVEVAGEDGPHSLRL